MKIKSTDGDSRCGGRRDWLGIIRKGKGERIEIRLELGCQM